MVEEEGKGEGVLGGGQERGKECTYICVSKDGSMEGCGGRRYIKDEYVETREWRARKGRGWKEYV